MLGSNRREERINKIRSYMPLRIIAVTFASLLMAININTFVHTGGLLPGGASGLTLLLQEAAGTFLGIKLPYTLINTIIMDAAQSSPVMKPWLNFRALRILSTSSEGIGSPLR